MFACVTPVLLKLYPCSLAGLPKPCVCAQAHRAADLSARALYGDGRAADGEDFDDDDLGDDYIDPDEEGE